MALLLPPALALALGAPLVPAPPTAPAPQRVLVVDLDDVGYDLLRDTPTPTLDWMESRGRTFDTFLTAPVCTPTRVMFQLGAYPSHADVLMGQVVPTNSSFRMPIAPLVPLGTLISGAGYTTAKIGKWHLAGPGELDHPNTCGWQYYAGAIENVHAPAEGYDAFTKVTNGVETFVTNTYLTTDETNDAIACVRAGINLVSVSYHAPHSPWHEPPAHLHTIQNLTQDRDKARAMLQACDRELGRLVREALVNGYLIMVFADNGTAQPIGGLKGTVLDGGVRVPFWAIGPGVVPGVDHSRIGATDFYDTLAELFGVSADGPERGPHSGSFLRALAGGPLERRFTYTEKFRRLGGDPRHSGETWLRAVRGENYKLRAEGVAPTFQYQLFDLANDPGETNDLLQGPLLTGQALSTFSLFFDVLGRLGSG